MFVNIQDFRFMWQGTPVAPLRNEQADLLNPIDIRGQGHDRALLLLHGFSSSPAVFRAMLPAFTQYDAVVCPVLPGHAESIVAFSNAKATDWVVAAEDACSALLRDYQAVDVMGLSLGGLLACHLSQCFTLNRLYLLAPALSLRTNVPVTLCLARVLHHLGFRLLSNKAGDIHINRYHELTYRQLPLAAIIEILSLINNFKFVRPTCPTELFLGRFDSVVDSPRVAELFANAPNVTTHWLENSAHILSLDGDIDELLAIIPRIFLQ